MAKSKNKDSYKMYVIVRSDLGMESGKIAAQAGHAFLGAYRNALKSRPNAVESYNQTNETKIALRIKGLVQLMKVHNTLMNTNFPFVLIKDAGHTVFDEPTITCIGLGPVRESEVTDFIKRLQLL